MDAYADVHEGGGVPQHIMPYVGVRVRTQVFYDSRFTGYKKFSLVLLINFSPFVEHKKSLHFSYAIFLLL